MGQDQAAQVWHLDLVVRGLGFHVGNAEQNQRRRFTRLVFPVTFDRGDFHRLILKGIQAVGVTNKGLHRRNHQGHPHRHREHATNGRCIATAQQVPGGRGTDEKCRGNKGGRGHVRQTVRERRVENHRQPVHRNDSAIDDFKTLRGLHPAVGGQDPEGRDQCADGHHDGREKVHPATDAVPAKQHDPQKTCFKEECGEYFIGQ